MKEFLERVTAWYNDNYDYCSIEGPSIDWIDAVRGQAQEEKREFSEEQIEIMAQTVEANYMRSQGYPTFMYKSK